MLLIAVSLLLIPSIAFPQLPCNDVTTSCVEHPNEPSTYQCITGPADFFALINAGKLLPAGSGPGQCESTPQRIVIKGEVSLGYIPGANNYTFAPNSEIVFADANSRLIVGPFRNLVLSGVSLHGCQTMWDQVLVRPNGILTVQNCAFKDGIKAITAEYNTTISITGSEFRQNATAIELGFVSAPQQSLAFTPGGSISGNKFYGDGALKLPNLGQKPAFGMRVLSVDDILIGKSGAARNEFLDFSNPGGFRGIVLSNTDATVVNCKFSGLDAPSSNQVDGAIAASNGSTLIFQGFGTSEAAIENCHTGIYTFNSSADIQAAVLQNVNEGLVNLQNNAASPSNYMKVTSCTFKSFHKKGILVEPVSSQSIPLKLSKLEIKNCIFDDNSIQTGLKQAVLIGSNVPATSNNFLVSDNKFYFRDRTSTSSNYSFQGIVTRSIYGGSGERNEFFDEGTKLNSSNNFFTGIITDGASGCKWHGNTLVGTNSNGVFNEEGFFVSNSPNCSYVCNNMDKLAYGMRMFGMCNSSVLDRNNFILQTAAALALDENGTVIGQQPFRRNDWPGNTAPIETFMRFDGYNPSDPQHILQVKKSEFKIHTSDMNSSYWANPRLVGNTLANDPHWFIGPIGDESIPQALVCTPYPPNDDPSSAKLDFGEKSIIDGTFTPFKGYAANTWETAFHLLGRMEGILICTLRPAKLSNGIRHNRLPTWASSGKYSAVIFRSAALRLRLLPRSSVPISMPSSLRVPMSST